MKDLLGILAGIYTFAAALSGIDSFTDLPGFYSFAVVLAGVVSFSVLLCID